jgi:hypothetical protein
LEKRNFGNEKPLVFTTTATTTKPQQHNKKATIA